MWSVLTTLHRWVSLSLCIFFGLVIVCAVLALFAQGTYEDVWSRIFLYTFVFSLPVCLAQLNKQHQPALTVARAALGILFCTILAILRANYPFWRDNLEHRLAMFVFFAAIGSVVLNERD